MEVWQLHTVYSEVSCYRKFMTMWLNPPHSLVYDTVWSLSGKTHCRFPYLHQILPVKKSRLEGYKLQCQKFHGKFRRGEISSRDKVIGLSRRRGKERARIRCGNMKCFSMWTDINETLCLWRRQECQTGKDFMGWCWVPSRGTSWLVRILYGAVEGGCFGVTS